VQSWMISAGEINPQRFEIGRSAKLQPVDKG
jgi:hypothetical protein